MLKTNNFSTYVKFDLKVRGVTLERAAEAVNVSTSHFLKEIKGKTKKGYASPETVAAMAHERLISPDTVDCWVEELRSILDFKKEKAAHKRRTNKNLLNVFYHIFGW